MADRIESTKHEAIFHEYHGSQSTTQATPRSAYETLVCSDQARRLDQAARDCCSIAGSESRRRHRVGFDTEGPGRAAYPCRAMPSDHPWKPLFR